MSRTIKITLVKSLIARKKKHIEVARQLGLRKMNSSVVHQDIPSIRGMVNLISYMVTVEECSS